MFDPLPPDLVAALSRLSSRLGAFSALRYLAEADSTNDLALELAVAGAAEGTAVLADLQRAGRGRRGRDWFSPPGAGLYLSVVVRPRGPMRATPFITLAAGVAAADAVREATALPVELKWPNDLVIGRPWRKLGGVLSETVARGGTIDAVVIGIGINLLQVAYPRDIADRATSIETELGRPVDRGALVVGVLGAMRDVVERLHAGDHAGIGRDWRRLGGVGLGGAAVRWLDREQERRGRALDIDDDGALLVEVGGRVERVIAGEVRWEGLSRE